MNKKVRILVAGDMIVDKYLHVVSEKLSQETLLPVLKLLSTETRPGGAGKTAKVLENLLLLQCPQDLNIESSYTGLVPDTFGEEFGENSVVLPLSQNPEDFFCYKTRIVSAYPYQQITRFDQDVTLDLTDHLYIEEIICRNITNYFTGDTFNIALVSDYDRGMINDITLKCIREHADLVIVDPRKKELPFYKAHGCDFLLPNDVEYQRYPKSERLEFLKTGRIVQKIGRRGCILHEVKREISSTYIKSYAEDPLSVVGAGDVFAASFALALGINASFGASTNPSHETLVQCLTMANTIAAVAVTNRVCEPTYSQEMEDIVYDAILTMIRKAQK